MQEVDDEQIDENNRPRNKRKKRKIVDITVMSEDGYLGAKIFQYVCRDFESNSTLV